MPGARRSSRRGSRKPVQSDSSDDDERASAAPVVSPRIRDAAKKASLRKEAEAKLESEDLASSSRSARRERRKSRRGSKKAPGEGKTVESVDAAELDARAQRRAQRRNKRTPRHNTPSARTGFFASSPTGNESSRSPSRSRGRQDAPEMTEVEVIAWQHRIKQPNGDDAHSDDQSDDDNVVIDHEHSSDDGDGGPRRHPVVKNSGGAWGSGPADGLKPRTSPGKRRELSPTNVRRRAMEKKKSREQLLAQPKKALGANNNADDGDGSPLARQRGGRTRTGRRGSKKAPEPSDSSSSSSESDEEITGRRRRGGRQRTRDRQNKPARGRRGTGNEPNTPGTPKDVPVGHDKTLRRTSHELQLVDGQDTPSGHKKLTRTSPKTDTPNSKDTSPHNIHAKLKQQLEKDGLKKKEVPEGKDSSSDSDSVSGSETKEESPRRGGVDFTSKARSGGSGSDSEGVVEPEVTPGDKGRAVFKGAFSRSPKKGASSRSPSNQNLRDEYSLAASANWVQRRQFLTTPVPVGAGIQQCKVVRSKKKDCFVLWLETMRPGKGKQVEFLMAGKQRKGAKATLNYVISMDESDHSRHGKGCIGKLRANMRTTEYILFDEGLNPTLAGNRRKAASPSNKTQLREELCLLQFVKGQMGFARGPREITAYLPFVNRKTLETLRCRPIREEDGLKSWVTQHDDDEPNLKTYKMINKPPVWNEQVRKYILNFNGRVEVASVKNFQLVLTQDPESLVLQCGRGHDSEDGSSTFILDFGWPLSPIQAFAIGLAGMTA